MINQFSSLRILYARVNRFFFIFGNRNPPIFILFLNQIHYFVDNFGSSIVESHCINSSFLLDKLIFIAFLIGHYPNIVNFERKVKVKFLVVLNFSCFYFNFLFPNSFNRFTCDFNAFKKVGFTLYSNPKS